MSIPQFILFLLAVAVSFLGVRRTFQFIVAVWKVARRRIFHLPMPSEWRPPQTALVAAGASVQVAALLTEGQIIAAISMYRRETGVRLRKAKDAVDDVLIRVRAKRVMDFGGSEQVATLLAADKIAAAIRAHRQELGVGQLEAKDYVKALRRHLER